MCVFFGTLCTSRRIRRRGAHSDRVIRYYKSKPAREPGGHNQGARLVVRADSAPYTATTTCVASSSTLRTCLPSRPRVSRAPNDFLPLHYRNPQKHPREFNRVIAVALNGIKCSG